MSRLFSAVSVVSVVLIVIAGFAVISPSRAFAYDCTSYYPYCHYHMWGWSGSGANGTRGNLDTPTNVYGISGNGGNYDTFTMSTWMWGSQNTGQSNSIEAGEAYGYQQQCQTYVAYFIPYGTKDDGGTLQEGCGTALTPGYTYMASAYHSGYDAHSRVQTGSYIVFDWNWGQYNIILSGEWGYDNMAQYEVLNLNGWATPSWSSSSISTLQWEDYSGNWNNWGYLNPSTDSQSGCPYASQRLSSTSFQAYKVSGCA